MVNSMDFDKIKQNILNSSETSTSESESISGSELHEEFEINNFLPEFEPLKLSGKNLAQQYVSAFNTGMNVYQCLNYLQGYVYTLVTAMNETIEAWNTVVPLLEQATKEWTDEEFDYKWSILKPQVIELVTNLTIETFNNAWEELKPVVIKLAQDTTDAEFKKQWDILKPQVITLVEETTTNKFNDEWEKLRPTIIQLSTDTTIEQFNRSWEELRPQVIELSQTTTSNKFDEKWEELRPQLIELAQTTTSNKFDEKWEELQLNVENNVSIGKVGTKNYYVLTESKDKNVKKLDLYVNTSFLLIPSSPSNSKEFLINGLDLEGYDIKMITMDGNLFRLSKIGSNDVFDYAHVVVDNATKTNKNSGAQDVATNLTIDFLAYFAKVIKDTPEQAVCYMQSCVSFILEKTSS